MGGSICFISCCRSGEPHGAVAVDQLARVHEAGQLARHDGVILQHNSSPPPPVHREDNVALLTSTAVQGRHMQPAGARVTSCHMITIIIHNKYQYIVCSYQESAHLADLGLVIGRLGAEQRHRGLLLPHLLRHGDREVSRVTSEVSRVTCVTWQHMQLLSVCQILLPDTWVMAR